MVDPRHDKWWKKMVDPRVEHVVEEDGGSKRGHVVKEDGGPKGRPHGGRGWWTQGWDKWWKRMVDPRDQGARFHPHSLLSWALGWGTGSVRRISNSLQRSGTSR